MPFRLGTSMRPRDAALATQLGAALDAFVNERWPLPGIEDAAARRALIEQLLESIHRIDYIRLIRDRDISPRREDPADLIFDPIKAAIVHCRAGRLDEAFWLAFLSVHFGKHKRAGWRYVREIYGRLGQGDRWDWTTTSADSAGFRAWLAAHQGALTRADVPHGFGNHRKYESLDAESPRGTGSVIASYIGWINPPRTHVQLFTETLAAVGGNPRAAFRALYDAMDPVISFGRTARFDYLAMIGKLGLAAIQPDSTYLKGATGPRAGAQLLFGQGEGLGLRDLQVRTDALDEYLHVGMQAIEDALCNWQKSPTAFRPFRG